MQRPLATPDKLSATWLLLLALALPACAHGLEPDRSGLEGGAGSGGTGATGGTGGDAGDGGTTSGTTSTSMTTSSSTTTTTSMTTSTTTSSTTTTTSSTTTTDTGPPPTGLYLQYKTTISSASTNQLKAVFNIVNGGDTPVSLDSITLRYHYTVDGDLPQEFHCDYAMIGCGFISGTFAMESGVDADYYMEVHLGPGAGTLAPGAQSGEIQARWNKQNFTNFDQSNDYSFNGALVDFTTWDKVTAYSNGTLVWGIEP
ncbi:MAG: cellulose binding domain-containing protein [Polyangiaceae bacterium]